MEGAIIVPSMIRLIAHQGGWDEILLFVAPLAIALLVISSFERRGRGRRDEGDAPDDEVGSPEKHSRKDDEELP
jgi:hypothetical protein